MKTCPHEPPTILTTGVRPAAKRDSGKRKWTPCLTDTAARHSTPQFGADMLLLPRLRTSPQPGKVGVLGDAKAGAPKRAQGRKDIRNAFEVSVHAQGFLEDIGISGEGAREGAVV